MRDDLVAAKTLNIPNADIFESVKRINRKELGYMLGDSFKPYKPSRSIISTLAINARKLGLENPFSLAAPGIYEILSQLYKLKLSPGSQFPDLLKPLKAVGGDEQSSITPNIPIQTQEVSEEVVQTSALPSNVNQNTGLTSIEEALLSNEEKAMRLKERGITA